MDFHGINAVGSIQIERVNTLPVIIPNSEIGRLVFNLDDGNVYIAGNSTWTLVANVGAGGTPASSISFNGTAIGILDTNVQTIVDNIALGLQAIIYDNAISGLSSGTIKTAIDELSASIGSGTASGIAVVPAGNIASTDVQAALEELDNEHYLKTEINSQMSGKSDTSHVHDTRYYQQGDIDTLLAGKSNTGHAHTVSDISDLVDPLQFRGTVNAASDFPTLAEVISGWVLRVLSDVTDDDPSKTNTGQSFSTNDEIAWNGSNWTVLGNAGSMGGDVVGPAGGTTLNNVPQWDVANKVLKDGLGVGTGANNLVQLDGSSKLPAVDGSNLTNLPGGSVISKSANYTLTTNDDIVLVDATPGMITITVPTAVGNSGREWTIKKIDSSIYAARLDVVGTETIDGSLTYDITNQWDAITIISDGINYYII